LAPSVATGARRTTSPPDFARSRALGAVKRLKKKSGVPKRFLSRGIR
jgi:hypothetical protein